MEIEEGPKRVARGLQARIVAGQEEAQGGGDAGPGGFQAGEAVDDSHFNEQAELKALAANDFLNARQRAHDAGCVHDQRGQSEVVMACASRAEAHWQEAMADVEKLAAAIHLRGHGHRNVKNYPAAITAFRESLNLNRGSMPYSSAIATDLHCLADAEFLTDDLDAAQRDYDEALLNAIWADNANMVAAVKGRSF